MIQKKYCINCNKFVTPISGKYFSFGTLDFGTLYFIENCPECGHRLLKKEIKGS